MIDVERVRAAEVLADDLSVSGHVYDLRTGAIDEVLPTQPIRSERPQERRARRDIDLLLWPSHARIAKVGLWTTSDSVMSRCTAMT